MFKYRIQAGDTEIDILYGKIKELQDKLKRRGVQVADLKHRIKEISTCEICKIQKATNHTCRNCYNVVNRV